MKSSFSALALIAFVNSASAAEYKNISIKSIKDIAVVVSPKGCTKTVEKARKNALLVFKRKPRREEVTIDCYGVILREVSGVNPMGRDETAGNVVLFPAGDSRAEAERIAEVLIAKMQEKKSEGVTVKLSSLRYIDQSFALSELTKDEAKDQVKIGGLTIGIHTVVKDGNLTYTGNQTMSIGIE